MTHAVPRGTVITKRDIGYAPVSSSVNISTLVTSYDAVLGKISPVRLAKGMLIPKTVIEDVPVVPRGYTSLDVSLASSSATLRVGQHIELIGADDTVSRSAIVIHIPRESTSRALWEVSEERNTAMTVALPAEEALRVLRAQTNSPIIAVPREGSE